MKATFSFIVSNIGALVVLALLWIYAPKYINYGFVWNTNLIDGIAYYFRYLPVGWEDWGARFEVVGRMMNLERFMLFAEINIIIHLLLLPMRRRQKVVVRR